jgi:hypothetical protein
MHGTIPPLPNTPSWHGAQLKHRDNFAFSCHKMEASVLHRFQSCLPSGNWPRSALDVVGNWWLATAGVVRSV